MLVVVIVVAVALGVAGLVVRSRRRPTAVAPPEPKRGAGPAAKAPPAVETGPRPAPRPAGLPTAQGLADRIRGLFRRGVTEQTWKDLEDVLIKADVGTSER